jgi:hypothetical protein
MNNGIKETTAQRRGESQPDQTALNRQTFTYDANGVRWLQVSCHEFLSNTIDLRVVLFQSDECA